jgi:tetratricopeptide (TPR) repeat protein
LRVLPNYPAAYRQQAEALLRLKRSPEAGQALDRYLKAGGKQTPEVYLARGLIHSQLKEHPAAVAAYTQALLRKEEGEAGKAGAAEALTQRGWAYLKGEAPRMALGDFEEAIKLRPGHAPSFCGRGHALVLLGRVTEAVRDGEEALRLKGGAEQEVLVACIFARAATLLNLTNRPSGRQEYEGRAVDLLCRALHRVPEDQRAAFWQKRILSEPALSTIRRHPRVSRLFKG